jgi:hypothetical protein
MKRYSLRVRDAAQALQEYTDRTHRQRISDEQSLASDEEGARKHCRTGSQEVTSHAATPPAATGSGSEIEQLRAHSTTS